MIIIPQHDESLMPIKLGPMTRVPEYALRKYGIKWDSDYELRRVIDISEADYMAEWDSGTEEQMKLVSKASERAGFGDKPQMLREAAAKVVAYLAQRIDGRIVIFDHGSGPGYSAKVIFEHLGENEKDRVHIILLDPSRDKVFGTAKEVLKKLGLKYRKKEGGFSLYADTDLNSLRYVEPGTVDFFVGVASIHHHAHIPFELYYELLKDGGILVSADWHNSVWEEPRRYLEFLEGFDWPKKREGLKHFQEVYPQAAIPIPEPLREEDRKANEQIRDFWVGYHEILIEEGEQGKNAIQPSEGHRPVERYRDQMKLVGFETDSEEIRDLITDGIIDSNPHQLVPGTTLWMEIVGKKPSKR